MVGSSKHLLLLMLLGLLPRVATGNSDGVSGIKLRIQHEGIRGFIIHEVVVIDGSGCCLCEIVVAFASRHEVQLVEVSSHVVGVNAQQVFSEEKLVFVEGEFSFLSREVLCPLVFQDLLVGFVTFIIGKLLLNSIALCLQFLQILSVNLESGFWSFVITIDIVAEVYEFYQCEIESLFHFVRDEYLQKHCLLNGNLSLDNYFPPELIDFLRTQFKYD